LVDFAHGKPIFNFHTDHHQSQSGVSDETETFFAHSSSNAETLNRILPKHLSFSDVDIHIISTVDSANFYENNITPEMMCYSTTKEFKKVDSLTIGLLCNRLLLAYKNKPNFLSELVLSCPANLGVIYNKILEISKNMNYDDSETIRRNHYGYTKRMLEYNDISINDNVLIQYGLGDMFKTGSYNRYTVFKNNPNIDMYIWAADFGLMQASYNPFKKRNIDIDLGSIKNKLLDKWSIELKNIMIPISHIKKNYEMTQKTLKMSNPNNIIGFNWIDLKTFWGDNIHIIYEGNTYNFDVDRDKEYQKRFKSYMNTSSFLLPENDFEFLSKFKISLYDIINTLSGGHKYITNISGFNFIDGNIEDVLKTFGTIDIKKILQMFQLEFLNLIKEENTL
jgi:hypothetical protein